jgi:hypothetical protein
MKSLVIIKSRLIEMAINQLMAVFIIASLIYKLEIYKISFLSESMLVILGLFITLCISFILKDQLLINNRISKTTLFFGLVLIFILLNSILVRFHLQLGAIFSLVIGIAFGKHLSVSKKSSWIVLIPFWLLAFYIISRLIENPDPNEVFIRSRNYISFYLLITVLPYYFLKTKNREKMSSIPALVLLLLSLYSLGRSGIISSMVLFMGAILHSVKKLKFKILFILIFTMVIGFSLFYFIDYYNLYLEYDRFSKIDEIATIGGRTGLLSNYYNHLDFFGVVFGVDTNNPAILTIGSYQAGHIHSSLINLLSVSGILFMVFLYFLFKKMKMFSKHNSTFIFFILALLIRISTEDGLLFDFFDYTIWMFFFVQINQISKWNYREIYS